jgi:3-dehydro-L-gulonate 2-dehydrogenase
MQVSFTDLQTLLETILLKLGFNPGKAATCARIFAENSRDGVHSHGLNRFPVFVNNIKAGLIDVEAEPEKVASTGLMEHWDGHLAPGMYSAKLCMERAIALAKEHGMGCVTIKNTNHWMRGGAYGWMAADKGCMAICATNARANMPPWGGTRVTVGNNPLVIAIPRAEGNIVLDMSLSQFSYGKLQEYELAGRQLPVPGGYDQDGQLTKDPGAITATMRTLPIGFWKGSGLSMVIDMLVAGLSQGRSVAQITKQGQEYGVSQFFLCMDGKNLDPDMINEAIEFTRRNPLAAGARSIYYPGEQTLQKRERSEKEGITVNDKIWEEVKSLC